MAKSLPINKASTVRRGASRSLPLVLSLDPTSAVTLQQQLYLGLRDAILQGRLAPGVQLPGSRALAHSLGVSRTTMALVFDQLRAEGYVEGHERTGTFVARLLPDRLLNARNAGPARRASSPPRGRTARLSNRGKVIAGLSVSSAPMLGGTGARAFRMGTPALDHFPLPLWGRLLSRAWRRVTPSQLAYAEPNGYAPLREAIAAYVRQARAVRCESGQVIIVSGAQQAFDLAARVLLDPGDVAAVEEPGYRGARAALMAAGVTLVPVPVDADGLQVDALLALHPAPRLACVTPSHQFPLGATLSARRRMALLEWARTNDRWIVEDDFDSEYRFRTRPLPSLQGMDSDARVLYVGTFSKTLFPSLRLGYLIVPASLVDAFARARAIVDRHPSALEQVVLADFIADGHFARHVRRMRGLYAERQATLLQLLGQQASEWLVGAAADAGMHLVAWLRDGLDDARVSQRAFDAGVIAAPLSALSAAPVTRGALMLGFAAFDRVTMHRGVSTLCEVLRTEAQRSTTRRTRRTP